MASAYLVVANKASPTTLDAEIKTQLEGLGWTVTYYSDEDAQPTMTGVGLVVIAESVNSTTLGTKYENVAVGVLHLDNSVKTTHDLSSSNENASSTQTQVTVTDTGFAGSAGKSGDVSILDTAYLLRMSSSSNVGAGAASFLSVVGSSTQWVGYYYDTGDAMLNSHTAEARRLFLGFFTEATSGTHLTAAWDFFDAAVTWLAGDATAGYASGTGAAYSAQMAVGYAAVILADGPRLYFRLGQSSGSSVQDYSGNGYTGTAEGTPTWSTTGLVTGGDTAVTLDGSTERITADALAQMAAGSWSSGFTLEVWAKPSQTTTEEHVIAFSTSTGSYAPAIFRDEPSDKWTYRDTGTPTDASRMEADSTASAGTVYHLVATRDASGNGVLYVNGVAQADTGTGLASPPTSNGLFTVGAEYDIGTPPTVQSRFTGVLDEAAVYPRALSAAEVLEHYQTGLGLSSYGNASAATGTGSALAVTATTSGNAVAGRPNASGTAYQASVTATASANIAHPGVATATGAANSATAIGASPMAVGCGTGTGAAANASFAIRSSVLPAFQGGAFQENTFQADTFSTTVGAPAGTSAGEARNAGTGIAPRLPGAATGSGTGHDVRSIIGFVGGVAAGTGAGVGTFGGVKASAGLAEASGTAITASVGKSSSSSVLEVATATGEANGVDPVVAAKSAATAAGTGAAANASAVTVTGIYATSVLATATGSTDGAAAKVGATAGTGAGTGEANSLDSSSTFTAGTATATGSGHGLAASLSAVPAAASGVGAALPLSFALRPQGGIATSTGAALAGSSALNGSASAASASGTAHGVTWSGTSRVSVTAGVATATGLARTTKRGHTGGTPPRGRGHHWTPRAEAATVS